jgi:D-alanyl-D-alanine carboxypeptidase
VKISKSAANQTGTTAGLKPGDKLTVLDLLHGMMLPSGNDAAFAIADYFGNLIAKEKISEDP